MSTRIVASNVVSQFSGDVDLTPEAVEDLQPPEPPRQVHAIAKSDHAIVWWDISNIYSCGVTHFEVKRYRLDDTSGEWVLKGTSKVQNIEARSHTIRNLQQMKSYRFTVTGVNKADKGPESRRSRSIYIEADLPNGWFRLHDSSTNRFFYYCPCSGKSMWTRPDDNKYFVDYAIARHFTDREMFSLIDIFNDEIRNYELVSKYRLKDCVEELGRPCSDIRYLHCAFQELVEGFTPEAEAHKQAEKREGRRLEKDSLRTFQGFMIMIHYIKYRALRVKQNPLYPLSELASLRGKRDDNEQGTRIGDWVLTKGRYISKMKYRGILSKQKSFFTCQEFRLYMRPEKRQYLAMAFDPEEIQWMEKIYLYLDIDMTGKIVLEEFCRFMTCLAMTYASRNNNRSESALKLSRVMSAASTSLAEGSNNTDNSDNVMDSTFIKIFTMLDKEGRGYLRFEDFALFFVSLPSRELDVRKGYLQRSDSLSSISHVSTKSLALSEKSGASFKLSNNNAIVDGDSVRSFYDNLGVDGGDNDSVSGYSSAGRAKFGKAESVLSKGLEISSMADLDEDLPTDSVLQGNEFRVLNVVSDLPELGAFHANAGDLSMIFDELLVSYRELTVWDTNKLHAADMLIVQSPPWIKKALGSARRTFAAGIERLKSIFKRKPQKVQVDYEEEVNSVDGSDNEVQEFADDEDGDQTTSNKRNEKTKKEANEVAPEDTRSNFLNGDVEDGMFSIFGGSKRDTTATHGPVCFCGCGNPYWIDEDAAEKAYTIVQCLFMGDRRKDGGLPSDGFTEVYEVQELHICEKSFQIRQFSWHRANANKVWPGTFNLAQYIDANIDIYKQGRIVELGAATGALAMFLVAEPRCLDVVTSDIEDDGEVEANIKHNFELNGVPLVPHLAHTWGSGWDSTARSIGSVSLEACSYKFIVASDILLYVSVYPQLVQTITELFEAGSVQEFLMSWNRRIPESSLFFENMSAAGFRIVHHGKCVYSFYRDFAESLEI